MSRDGLLRLLCEYGVNIEEVKQRFVGNFELYEYCLKKFIEEKEIEKLDEAMREKAYEAAFHSAHSLKGVSGNLGLRPIYEADYALVEELRAKNYQKAEELLPSVRDEYERFARIFGEEL